MDMTPTMTPKSPEPESEIPSRIQPAKTISFTNGVLKRYHQHHHAVVVTYKECLKNHAAAMGGHAVDGCGEFMPSPSSNPSDPTSLKCAACSCHRNFHRRDPDENAGAAVPAPHPSSAAIEYQPHHRHHPPPPPPPLGQSRSPNSASPPPISSSYMLLALSSSKNNNNHNNNLAFSDLNFSNNNLSNQTPSSRKRFRTKFSQCQKEKMHEFAERVGWKMQKRDEEAVREFCREIGVDKGVLKVWMHNNKNTVGRRDPFPGDEGERRNDNGGESNHNAVVGETNHGGNGNDMENNGSGKADEGGGGRCLTQDLHQHGGGFESDSGAHGGNTNGSSSSS